MPGPRRRGSGSSSPKKVNNSPKKEATQSPANDADVDENTGDDDTFDREIAWCIERLEAGLLASKTKLPTSQTHEWVRILKVLRNPKAAYVKKRQYMRSAFGDYRQKMSEEAKRYAAKTRKISMKSTSLKDQKSKFIKKSCHQDLDPGTSGGDSFCFNFNIAPGDPEPGADLTQCNSAPDPEIGKDATQCEGGSVNGLDSAAAHIPLNFYKMESSDNSFKFNFTPSDDT